MNATDLALFSHLVKRSEAELSLPRTALLIAQVGQPQLDIPHYMHLLDELGEAARAKIASAGQTSGAIDIVLRFVYGEIGFRGNGDDYYDVRNSFLSDVLDRRIGIPITLAIVLIEILNRAGIEACGISFPGHYLARAVAPSGAVYIDPFSGQILASDQLRDLYQRMTGSSRPVDPQLFEPSTKRGTLVRMLNNLRGIYMQKGDREKLREILQCMNVLEPSKELAEQIDRLSKLASSAN